MAENFVDTVVCVEEVFNDDVDAEARKKEGLVGERCAILLLLLPV